MIHIDKHDKTQNDAVRLQRGRCDYSAEKRNQYRGYSLVNASDAVHEAVAMTTDKPKCPAMQWFVKINEAAAVAVAAAVWAA